MKKAFYLCITIALLFSFMISSNVYAVNGQVTKQSGLYLCLLRANDVAARYKPINETQAKHTKGIQTTIGVNTSYTRTLTASASVTVGGGVFVELSGSLGVSDSQSCTVEHSVSYTLPATTASGKYRITTVFPCSGLVLEKWTAEGARDWIYVITYAPDVGDSYYKLERYSN
ncbi:MAG: hypothetical protein RR352_01450 [Clostridia bacterium]